MRAITTKYPFIRAEQFGSYWTVACYPEPGSPKQLLGTDNEFHSLSDNFTVYDVRAFSESDAERKAAQLTERCPIVGCKIESRHEHEIDGPAKASRI